MNKTIRIQALFLAIFAFLLFCCGPMAQSAQALVVEGSLIAVIIAALAAMGITFVASQGYESLESYVDSLLSEYATSRGLSVGELFSGTQVGSNSLGKLLLNNRFVVLINGFAAWLKIKFSLVNNSNITAYNYSNVSLQNGSTLPIYTVDYKTHSKASGSWWSNELNYSNTIGLVKTSTDNTWEFSTGYKVRLWFVSNQWHCRMYDANDTALDADHLWGGSAEDQIKLVFLQNTLGYYWNPFALLSVFPDSNHVSQGPIYFNSASFENYFITGMSIRTGTILLPSDDPLYTDGDGAVIDVGIGWGSTYGDIIDGIEGSIDSTGEVEASITYDSEDVVAEQVEDTPSQVISSDVSDYQAIGLQNVFPFCIPFDIYAFFECLAADPVAPVVTWRFYVPGICDEEITLDLSQFNAVAQIVRTMELLAFIVGLALVTREKFLRG